MNLKLINLSLSRCNIASVIASTLAVVKDKQWKSPVSNITAQNGYPDGLCTKITGRLQWPGRASCSSRSMMGCVRMLTPGFDAEACLP